MQAGLEGAIHGTIGDVAKGARGGPADVRSRYRDALRRVLGDLCSQYDDTERHVVSGLSDARAQFTDA